MNWRGTDFRHCAVCVSVSVYCPKSKPLWCVPYISKNICNISVTLLQRAFFNILLQWKHWTLNIKKNIFLFCEYFWSPKIEVISNWFFFLICFVLKLLVSLLLSWNIRDFLKHYYKCTPILSLFSSIFRQSVTKAGVHTCRHSVEHKSY